MVSTSHDAAQRRKTNTVEQGNPNAVTITKTADGSIVGKRVFCGADGKLKKETYKGSKSFYWTSREVHVDGIYGLKDVLESLRNSPTECVIRGAAATDFDTNQHHNRRGANKKNGVYQDVGRCWMGIDIDGFSFDTNEFDPYGEPEEFFEHMCRQISPDLEDVTVVYQFSSSAGIQQKGKPHNVVKVHLWFWLDRPYTCNEIARWARAVNTRTNSFTYKDEKKTKVIDTNPLQPVGILYTADPVLDGVSTAVVRRVGIVDLGKEEASLTIPSEHQVKALNASGSTVVDGKRIYGFRKYVHQLRKLDGGEGAHDFYRSAAASYFLHAGPDADDTQAKAEIVDAIRSWTNHDRKTELLQRAGQGGDVDRAFESGRDFARKKWEEGFTPIGDRNATIETDTSVPRYPAPKLLDRDEARRAFGAYIDDWFDHAVRIAFVNKRPEDRADITLERVGVPVDYNARKVAKALVGFGKTALVNGNLGERAQAILDSLNEQFGTSVSITIAYAHLLKKKASEAREDIADESENASVDTVFGPVSEGFCQKPKAIEAAQKAGISPSTVCGTCPARFVCKYRFQIADIQKSNEEEGRAQIRVIPHQYLALNSAAGSFDVVIVDETYAPVEEFAIPASDIVFYAFDFSDFVQPEEGEEDAVEIELINEILNALSKVFTERPNEILSGIREIYLNSRMRKIEPRDFRRAAVAVKAVIRQRTPDNLGNVAPSSITRQVKAAKLDTLSQVEKILIAFADEFEAKRSQSNFVRIIDEDNGVQSIEFRRGLAPERVAKSAPVLLLDATARPEVIKRTFARLGSFDFAEFQAPDRTTYIQLTLEQGWSARSLSANGSKDKVEAVVSFINRLSKPFVAAPEKVEVELRKHLPTDFPLAHFRALRGLNTFEDCETAVIVTNPDVPPEAVVRDLRAWATTDDGEVTPQRYQAADYRIRTVEGHEEGPELIQTCNVFPDPVLEEFRQAKVEDEVVQAIGRVRGYHNERTVFLLSNNVYDLTIDHVHDFSRTANCLESNELALSVLQSGANVIPLTRSAVGKLLDTSRRGAFVDMVVGSVERFADLGGFQIVRKVNPKNGSVIRLAIKGEPTQDDFVAAYGSELTDIANDNDEHPLLTLAKDALDRQVPFVIVSKTWIKANDPRKIAKSRRKLDKIVKTDASFFDQWSPILSTYNKRDTDSAVQILKTWTFEEAGSQGRYKKGAPLISFVNELRLRIELDAIYGEGSYRLTETATLESEEEARADIARRLVAGQDFSGATRDESAAIAKGYFGNSPILVDMEAAERFEAKQAKAKALDEYEADVRQDRALQAKLDKLFDLTPAIKK